MTIRFQCASCTQPIEVDDEWALKAVACPYCHKTITAPGESSLEDPSMIGTASPMGHGEADHDEMSAETPERGLQPAPSNRVASIALVLAICSFILIAAYIMILSQHPEEIGRLYEAFEQAKDFPEKTAIYSEFIQEQGRVPGWMVASSGCIVGGGLAWVAAIICGLMGIRSAVRRQRAVAALLLTGLIPIILCCGGAGGPTV